MLLTRDGRDILGAIRFQFGTGPELLSPTESKLQRPMRETSSSFGNTISYENGTVALSEILSALTFALDMTEGAVPGHALRTCLIGMRLGNAIELPAPLMRELYYALLLKDVGCSSNAARLCAIVGGGDERAIKAGSKLGDSSDPKMWKMLWKNVLPGSNGFRRALQIAKMGKERQQNNQELFELRCDRGGQILRKLEMGDLAADAVYHLDEFWDGSGYPSHKRGTSIPLLSRICSVAQNLDVFANETGAEAAIDVLEERQGTWFDPYIVYTAKHLHKRGKLWRHCLPGDDVEVTRSAVLDLDDGEKTPLTANRIDSICEAFASVVDAKSPFTFQHSIGVAETSTALARQLKLPVDRVHLVRRAALLHDVGKLRVPNSILDKNGRPTDDEWTVIREHPMVTRSILSRVSAFHELAIVAAEHHEKLDGSGYPDGLRGEQMSIEARIIAVSDMFTAMVEKRPYRGPVDPIKVLGILEKDVPHKLDATCFEGLSAMVYAGWSLPQNLSLPGETCELIPMRPSSQQQVAISDVVAA